jgi:hypothetical protein
MYTKHFFSRWCYRLGQHACILLYGKKWSNIMLRLSLSPRETFSIKINWKTGSGIGTRLVVRRKIAALLLWFESSRSVRSEVTSDFVV